MHLWTEYEGRTIAGAYTLGKLLRSEGRNGFFATSDTTGNSAVIRLTEAHYDEDELLKRWRHVAGMHEDNLIEIERFGQTDFDGVALTYALMEPNDANLADVLRERPLTTTETTEVAKSVLAAISALHTSGLVHEHIEPDNILAVGEVVKLRSDCVRECVPDNTEFNTPEGCAELRRRDVHDFGVLMLQCLTLEKQLTPGLHLPTPFNRIIPGAIEGTWTLDQIRSVLDPLGAAPKAPAAQAPAAATTNGASTGAAGKPSAAKPTAATPSEGAKPAASTVAAAPAVRPVPEKNSLQAQLPLSAAAAPLGAKEGRNEPAIALRRERSEEAEPAGFSLRPVLMLCIASAVLLVIVAWHFLAGKPAKPAVPAGVTAAASAPAAPIVRTAPQTVVQPPAEAAGSLPSVQPAAGHAPGWYVIAFTYNHQAQAQNKADHLNARRRGGLHTTVFSPREGTYLVSLGGPMSEAEAKGLQKRARRAGMPRDTYIRNFR